MKKNVYEIGVCMSPHPLQGADGGRVQGELGNGVVRVLEHSIDGAHRVEEVRPGAGIQARRHVLRTWGGVFVYVCVACWGGVFVYVCVCVLRVCVGVEV